MNVILKTNVQEKRNLTIQNAVLELNLDFFQRYRLFQKLDPAKSWLDHYALICWASMSHVIFPVWDPREKPLDNSLRSNFHRTECLQCAGPRLVLGLVSLNFYFQQQGGTSSPISASLLKFQKLGDLMLHPQSLNSPWCRSRNGYFGISKLFFFQVLSLGNLQNSNISFTNKWVTAPCLFWSNHSCYKEYQI